MQRPDLLSVLYFSFMISIYHLMEKFWDNTEFFSTMQNECQNKWGDTLYCGPGSSVSIATEYGLDGPGIESQWETRFSARPDRPWDPPNLLYNGYRVFPRGKEWPGRAADHSPPSSAAVMED